MDGLKIRETRIQRGLSQRELGEQVGTHQTTISKIERLGWEPAGALAASIARVLSVGEADLEGDGRAAYKPNGVRRSEHRRIPQAQEALAPADDPRVRELLQRVRRMRRPGTPRVTYYRCTYCDARSHTEETAVRHAVACDPKFPGYSEVRVRYVDLSNAPRAPRPLRNTPRS